MFTKRLTDDDLSAFRQQFDRLDVDCDGLVSQQDLRKTLAVDDAELMVSEMMTHLNEGETKNVSFEQFLESRMMYDLSTRSESIFSEILSAEKVDSDSLSSGTSSCSSDTEEECITVATMMDFISSHLPLNVPICPRLIDEVFEKFGATKGVLTSQEFGDALHSQTLSDVIGMDN